MSKVAICDNCAATDDMNIGKGPFLNDGVVLGFYRDNNTEPEAELEICEACKNRLLKALPNLAKKLKECA
jgi:hypothetical protein